MTKKNKSLRRCVGCGLSFEVHSLLRVVRTPEQEVMIDFFGKRNGRGAYLCKNINCFERAIRSKGFERTLKCNIPSEIKEVIGKELEK